MYNTHKEAVSAGFVLESGWTEGKGVVLRRVASKLQDNQ